MDTRMDFQRLLEDMDKVIQAKRQELSELDERLESARVQLSEQEAKELTNQDINEEPDGEEGKQIAQSEGQAISRGIELISGSGKKFIPKKATHHRLWLEGSNHEEQAHFQDQRLAYERQLEQFGEELTELESINQELVRENKFLRQELNKSAQDNNDLRDKVHVLSESLEEVKSANLELNLQLAKADSELKLKQKLLKKTNDEDEILMDAFCDKLESLKKIIQLKDEEIRFLEAENQLVSRTFEDMRLTMPTIDPLNEQKVVASINYKQRAGKEQPSVYYDSDKVDTVVMESSNNNNNRFYNDSNISRQKVIEIVSAFREKDSQIELLKSQLLQANKDLESLRLKSKNKNLNLEERIQLHELPLVSNSVHGHQDQVKLALNDHQQEQILSRYKMLESELEAKDQQLHLAEYRNHHYETIMPKMISDLIQGLQRTFSKSENLFQHLPSESGIDHNSDLKLEEQFNELLNKIQTLTVKLNELLSRMSMTQGLLVEIDKLRCLNEEKGAQITRLVRELNRLDEAKVSPENDEENMVLDEATSMTALTSNSRIIETEIEQLNLDEQTKRNAPLVTLEGSRAKLQSITVRSVLDQQVSPKLSNSCEKRELKVVENETVIETSNEQEKEFNISSLESQQVEQDDDPTTTMKDEQAEGAPSTSSTTSTVIDTALLETQSRYLKNENELLELAMKEILLSLKWSDAQCSTILIDCPSLERLCQLIEARYLARTGVQPNEEGAETSIGGFNGDLFQLVVLKSELDLLRGQNEQLRAQMKSQRQDYLELILQVNSRLELQEASCQTDLPATDAIVSYKEYSVDNELEEKKQNSLSVGEKSLEKEQLRLFVDSQINRQPSEQCKNCSKMLQLTNHLLQCIVRVETRLSLGEEVHIGRLINLHQLIKSLERDLSVRERQVNELRLESIRQSETKLSIESKLHYMEEQMNTHLKTCPLLLTNLSQTTSLLAKGGGSENLQVFTTAKNGKGDSIQSLTIKSRILTAARPTYRGEPIEAKARNPQLTIALLQSIIGCLQARINYKDERLKQLELLLLSQAKENRQTTQHHRQILRVSNQQIIKRNHTFVEQQKQQQPA